MRGPGAVPHKSGTNRTTRRHPMSTSVTPTFPQAIGRPDHQGSGHGSTSRATSANAAWAPKTCPRRAGRPPGWPPPERKRPVVDRVWHPADLPHGYRAATRGQSYPRPSPITSRAAPGPPHGRAPPGRRDATRLPARKIIRACRLAERHYDLSAYRHTARHGTPPSPLQTTGSPPSSHDASYHWTRSTSGPSLGRGTLGSIEKPGEIARAFLPLNPLASSHWRRWRSVERTSWPVSRILLAVAFPSS
jgi:hypothetical protein